MRKRKVLTHEEVVAILKDRQGERSLRQLAQELQISPAYLSDVYLGRRRIGKKILKHLGLVKTVTTEITYS